MRSLHFLRLIILELVQWQYFGEIFALDIFLIHICHLLGSFFKFTLHKFYVRIMRYSNVSCYIGDKNLLRKIKEKWPAIH